MASTIENSEIAAVFNEMADLTHIVNGDSQCFGDVEEGKLHLFWYEREDMGAQITIRVTY